MATLEEQIRCREMGFPGGGHGVWRPQSGTGPPATVLCSIAPEVVGRQRYGRPVDCWAIGVIMYIL